VPAAGAAPPLSTPGSRLRIGAPGWRRRSAIRLLRLWRAGYRHRRPADVAYRSRGGGAGRISALRTRRASGALRMIRAWLIFAHCAPALHRAALTALPLAQLHTLHLGPGCTVTYTG